MENWLPNLSQTDYNRGQKIMSVLLRNQHMIQHVQYMKHKKRACTIVGYIVQREDTWTGKYTCEILEPTHSNTISSTWFTPVYCDCYDMYLCHHMPASLCRFKQCFIIAGFQKYTKCKSFVYNSLFILYEIAQSKIFMRFLSKCCSTILR